MTVIRKIIAGKQSGKITSSFDLVIWENISTLVVVVHKFIIYSPIWGDGPIAEGKQSNESSLTVVGGWSLQKEFEDAAMKLVSKPHGLRLHFNDDECNSYFELVHLLDNMFL